jgi:hypothetical protein
MTQLTGSHWVIWYMGGKQHMGKTKGSDRTRVVSISLPESVVRGLPQTNRSEYIRRLLMADQSVALAARRAMDAPGAPERVRDAREPVGLAVRVAARLDALEGQLRALGEAEARLRQQASSIEQELGQVRDQTASALQSIAGLRSTLVESLPPAEARQRPSAVAQNVDPFAGCPDPDRPGRVRLATAQDGSTRFEQVPSERVSDLPPPEPIARPSLRPSRKEDLL